MSIVNIFLKTLASLLGLTAIAYVVDSAILYGTTYKPTLWQTEAVVAIVAFVYLLVRTQRQTANSNQETLSK